MCDCKGDAPRLNLSQAPKSFKTPRTPLVTLLSFTHPHVDNPPLDSLAALSKSEILRQYPIGTGLDAFRDSFSSVCAKLGLPDASESMERFPNHGEALKSDAMLLLTYADLEILALKLFGALQNLSTVNYLLSSTRRENLLYSLVVLSSLVVSGGINVDSVIPIFQRVIKHAPDDDVWNAALALAASQAAPPTIPSKAALDTPLKFTSSSQQGSEQTSDDVQSIFYEICDCVYTNTKDFYEKYFEGKSWSSTVEEFADATKLEMTDCCWTEHPNPPSRKAVFDWFRAFQARFLPGRRGTFCPSHSKPLNGSKCKRQPDLFLAPFGT
jgi:hypothetical protein